MRFLSVIMFAAALLAAGCGKAPAPDKPAPPPPAPPEASTQPGPVPIVWGPESGGVQAGLRVDFPTFESGQPMDFAVCVRAVSAKDATLPDGHWLGAWCWTFRSVDGGVSWSARRMKQDEHSPANLLLANGRTEALQFHIFEEGWYFEDARLDERPPGPVPADSPWAKVKFAEPVHALPPGRYAVTASYEHPEHPNEQPCPFWHGQAVAGPVQIEIKPMPKEIAWGEPVNGLRLGLPRRTEPFNAGEPMRTTLLMENLSDQARLVRRMLPVDFVGHDFTVEISRQDGSMVPAKGGCSKLHVLEPAIIRPKRAFKLVLDLLSQGCVGVRELPPGKYTVKVSLGAISTAPVEFEVRAKAPAAARAKAPRVTGVGFTVNYADGWSADTFFGEDLRVFGGHLSRGNGEVFLHKTSDKASHDLWGRLSDLALQASSLPAKPLQPRPEKLYAIAIDLSDGRNLRFEAELEAGYKEPALQALADLLHANERVYSHQQGQGWTLEVKKDPASRPTEIAWGAAANGLQVGLKVARPAFVEGEPLAFTVHLRNVGDAAKDVGGIHFDDFFFRPVGGGVTLRSRWIGAQAAPPIKPPPPLEAGRGLESPATVGGEDWHFEDASQPRPEAIGKPVHFPPAGKYVVTVGSTTGRIPSGEVEVEIRARAPAGGAAAPAPGTSGPEAVAWGQAVNGLQMGLVTLGGVQDASEHWWQNWECPACRISDRAGVAACDICGKQGHVLAHCSECIGKHRVCIGCRTPRPSCATFLATETLFLELHFRTEPRAETEGAPGRKPAQLKPGCWQILFTPKNGGQSRIVERDPDAPLATQRLVEAVEVQVTPGGHAWVLVEVGPAWRFAWPDLAPIKALPPGRYTVTVSHDHLGFGERGNCPFWHGHVTSGPVEIEIRPGATAALNEDQIVARARAIGRQRWSERMVHAPGTVVIFDDKPTVTRKGDTWTVVFQRGALQIAGARAIVVLDASGRELSIDCAFSPQ
ncbi:MAG TPA: hypothetical protein PK280_01230 [Planctomycetota bacterium]|nr:hypothetical protein [Planctomycetota bacterium]